MKNERVLAYTLAKEIDNKELAEVSGGSVQATLRPTGSSPRDYDGVADVSVDF